MLFVSWAMLSVWMVKYQRYKMTQSQKEVPTLVGKCGYFGCEEVVTFYNSFRLGI